MLFLTLLGHWPAQGVDPGRHELPGSAWWIHNRAAEVLLLDLPLAVICWPILALVTSRTGNQFSTRREVIVFASGFALWLGAAVALPPFRQFFGVVAGLGMRAGRQASRLVLTHGKVAITIIDPNADP